MTQKYTTAFIGITPSGELFIISQYQGTSLMDCAKWRIRRRTEIAKLFGEVCEVTLKHKTK